jgi:hypothetical protein
VRAAGRAGVPHRDLLLTLALRPPPPSPPLPSTRRSYNVLNWNYDPAKNSVCRDKNQNPQQCSRASEESISLLGSIITCRHCWLFLGGDLRFRLRFDRRTIYDFLAAASATASTAVDVQVALPALGGRSTSTVNVIPSTEIVTIPLPIGTISLSLKLFSSLDVEITTTSTTSGRIIGPGFWFEASVTVGAQYANERWTDLTTTSLYMNSRSPVLDLTYAANVRVKFIATLEVRAVLMNSINWPMYFHLKPFLDIDVRESARCSTNFVTMSLAAGLDRSVSIGGPTIEVLGFTLGPFFDRIDYPDVHLIYPTPFACIGCAGCVDGANLASSSTTRNSSCAVEYKSGPWGECQADCGSGIQTRTVQCRDCNGYLATGCTGALPSTVQTCTSSTSCSGVRPLTILKPVSGALDQATTGSLANWRIFRMDPPTRFITAVDGDTFTYPYMAFVLESYSGDADLYMFYIQPTTAPAADGSSCCARWGSCPTPSTYFGSSCKSDTATDSMDLTWGSGNQGTLYFLVGSKAPTSQFKFTGAYYNYLKSSVPIPVGAGAAVAGTNQMFRYTSSSTAYGFVTFVTPATGSTGDVDLYVKGWNFTDWPSKSNYLVASTNVGEDFIVISGSNFVQGSEYALLVDVFSTGAYSIVAADLFILEPGIPTQKVALRNGLTYFTFDVPAGADRVDVVVSGTNDADVYVGNKFFRPINPESVNGNDLVANCPWYSRLGGDDSVHIDWTDPNWSNKLVIAVYGYSAADFTITATPHLFMGEATPYRVTTRFDRPIFLLSGEGRSPGASYASLTGVHVYDNSDCEFFSSGSTTCASLARGSPYLPSSMSTCIYGKRMLLGGGNESGAESAATTSRGKPAASFAAPRALAFETLGLANSDKYTFGARVAEKRAGSASVEAHVMAWRAARKYPTCFTTATPSTYEGKFTIGRTNPTQYQGVTFVPNIQGSGIATLPMAVYLQQKSVTDVAGSGRLLADDEEPSPSSSSPTSTQASSVGGISIRPAGESSIYIVESPPAPSSMDESFDVSPQQGSSSEQGMGSYASLAGLRDDVHFTWAGDRTPVNDVSISPGSGSFWGQGGRRRRLQSGSGGAFSANVTLVSAPAGTTPAASSTTSVSCNSGTSACRSLTVPSSAEDTLVTFSIRVPLAAQVRTMVRATAGDVPVPVSSTAEAILVPSASSTPANERPATVARPFNGIVGASQVPVTIAGGLAAFDMRLCDSATASPNSMAVVVLTVDLAGASTASIVLDVFVSVAEPTCPLFTWKSGAWSTCAGAVCSDTTGTQSRTVMCVSSDAPTVAVTPGPNTCDVASTPSTSLSCTRVSSCSGSGTSTYTSGSLTTDVDVMSYTARTMPSTSGSPGPSVDVPSSVSSVWSYPFASSTSSSASASTGAICLSLAVTPRAINEAGCSYEQLLSVFACTSTLSSCKTSAGTASPANRCACYTAFSTCMSSLICDGGIWGRFKGAATALTADIAAGYVANTCTMPSSTVPVASSAAESVNNIAKSLASVQVLAVPKTYSGSNVDLWLDTASSVWSASVRAGATGTALRTVKVPLFFSAKSVVPSSTASLEVLVAANSPVLVTPSITALTMSSASVVVSGPTTATEAQIREGGLTWTLAVQCDTLLQSAFTPASNALIVAGIKSSSSVATQPFGWAAAAVPVLQASGTTVGVAYVSSTSLSITLPAVPFYKLTAPETLRFKIPGAYTASGLDNDLQVSVTVSVSSASCSGNAWGSATRTSNVDQTQIPSTYTRTRTSSGTASGNGDACPALTSTTSRSFTDFDAACAFVSCSGRGTCVIVDGSALCACAAGFFGPTCAIDSRVSAAVSVEGRPGGIRVLRRLEHLRAHVLDGRHGADHAHPQHHVPPHRGLVLVYVQRRDGGVLDLADVPCGHHDQDLRPPHPPRVPSGRRCQGPGLHHREVGRRIRREQHRADYRHRRPHRWRAGLCVRPRGRLEGDGGGLRRGAGRDCRLD